MIKDIGDVSKLKLNVFLKDGSEYLGKHSPPKPFGEYDKLVGFWEGESLIIIPLDLVKKVEMYFEK